MQVTFYAAVQHHSRNAFPHQAQAAATGVMEAMVAAARGLTTNTTPHQAAPVAEVALVALQAAAEKAAAQASHWHGPPATTFP